MEQMKTTFDAAVESGEAVSTESSMTQNEFVLVEEELFVPALLQEC